MKKSIPKEKNPYDAQMIEVYMIHTGLQASGTMSASLTKQWLFLSRTQMSQKKT